MAASTAVDGVDLDEIYAFTIQLAKEAGQMLLAAVDARSGKSGQAESTEKESAVDIVTQTDEAVFFGSYKSFSLVFATLLQSVDHSNPFPKLGRGRTAWIAAGQRGMKRGALAHGQLGPDTSILRNHTISFACTDWRLSEDVEAFIRTKVSDRFPTHTFIGEETYSKGASRDYLIPGKGPSWCVDPLDGTVNFTHLAPFYCVSIAFLWNGNPVVGVVNAPFLRQLFTACHGKGAWLNEATQLPLDRNPIPPMPAAAPKGCVFSCEWGKDRRDIKDGNMHRKVNSFMNLAAELGGRDGLGGMVHGVRSLGSATLDLCYIATGGFDIWWEGGCWEWDVAAGFCLVKEAGGLITTANPPSDPTSIPDAHLGSRLYLAIRPAGDTDGETGRQSQERTVREVWRRVQTLDYSRPGI